MCIRLLLALATGMAMACSAAAAGPRFPFDAPANADGALMAGAVAGVSQRVLAAHAAGRVQVPATALAHLHIAAGDGDGAVDAIRAVMDGLAGQGDAARSARWVPYLLHAQALAATPQEREAAYAAAFAAHFASLDDLQAKQAHFWFGGDPGSAMQDLRAAVERLEGPDGLTLDAALDLARRQALVDALAAAAGADALIAADDASRFVVDEDVLIRTSQGVTLSAVVARSRRAGSPLPTAMQFTIYTEPAANREIALQAAARGYVGVVVDSRGKRLGTDAIRPYETEVDDASAAVGWIARQPWSDGRVAMYGGSYSGFAAWAAAKRMPPALKAIAPWAAAIPGFGLPMENNVFLNANYAWPFYVASDRLLDREVYADAGRWQRLPERWYASGRPYREIDLVDGTPNPWLQRWLSHPAYDAYWQAMVPFGEEFARIDIPVLTITGYYDDTQISALRYFTEHLRHRPDAAHDLLIGPYDHFGAQASIKPRRVGGYGIDPVAQFDTVELTFQWLDHVLRGGPRPALLRDRVNYQLMGANEWRHAPSLGAAADATTFHLSGTACGRYRCLSRAPQATAPLVQRVDFADRSTQGHGYYPDPVVRDGVVPGSGFGFVSAPFDRPTSVVGTFAGELTLRIDRRDLDFSVSLYELMADGRAMQLSYYVGRASHARDLTRRELLVPGEWTTVPFERSRMTARRLEAGSRLLVVVDVLKDARHQVNMGTGGDVSDESIADARQPMTVEWHPRSTIRLPLRQEPAP